MTTHTFQEINTLFQSPSNETDSIDENSPLTNPDESFETATPEETPQKDDNEQLKTWVLSQSFFWQRTFNNALATYFNNQQAEQRPAKKQAILNALAFWRQNFSISAQDFLVHGTIHNLPFGLSPLMYRAFLADVHNGQIPSSIFHFLINGHAFFNENPNILTSVKTAIQEGYLSLSMIRYFTDNRGNNPFAEDFLPWFTKWQAFYQANPAMKEELKRQVKEGVSPDWIPSLAYQSWITFNLEANLTQESPEAPRYLTIQPWMVEDKQIPPNYPLTKKALFQRYLRENPDIILHYQEDFQSPLTESFLNEWEPKRLQRTPKFVPPPKPIQQYTNPYVQAIANHFSKREPWFFWFDKNDVTGIPYCLQVCEKRDAITAVEKFKKFLSETDDPSLSFRKHLTALELYWPTHFIQAYRIRDRLNTQNVLVHFDALLDIIALLPNLTSIKLFSDGFDHEIDLHYLERFIKILQERPAIKDITFDRLRNTAGGAKQLYDFQMNNKYRSIDIAEGDTTGKEIIADSNHRRTQLWEGETLLLAYKKTHFPEKKAELYIDFDEVAASTKKDITAPEPAISSEEKGIETSDTVEIEPQPASSHVIRFNEVSSQSSHLSPDIQKAWEQAKKEHQEITVPTEWAGYDDEDIPVIQKLIDAMGEERVKFYHEHTRLKGIIGLIQSNQYTVARIAQLDLFEKKDGYYSTRKLPSLLGYDPTIVANAATHPNALNSVMAFEWGYLNPAEWKAFKQQQLTPQQQAWVKYLQDFYDDVLTAAVKDRCRLFAEWQALEQKPSTCFHDNQKERLLVEKKIALLTDFIQHQSDKLTKLIATVENKINHPTAEQEENKVIRGLSKNKRNSLKEDQQFLLSMNGHDHKKLLSFSSSVSNQLNREALNEGRHWLRFGVQKFFAGLATAPALLVGLFTCFQFFNDDDIKGMFRTKSQHRLFKADQKSDEIQRKLEEELNPVSQNLGM